MPSLLVPFLWPRSVASMRDGVILVIHPVALVLEFVSPVLLSLFRIDLVAPFLLKLKDNFLLRQISFVTFGINADASFLALPLDVLN